IRITAAAVDSAQGTRFGGDQTFALQGQVTLTVPSVLQLASWGRADANGLFSFPQGGSSYNGPRWWSGATNETTPDPNGGNCHVAVFVCGNTLRVPNV